MTTGFECKKCGVTSIYEEKKIPGFTFKPRCQNDGCNSQWWNRLCERPLVEQMKDLHRAYAESILEEKAQ